MFASIPTHIVLNKRTGDIISRARGKAFTQQSAREFADTMNATGRVPVFLVCELTPEFSHERA